MNRVRSWLGRAARAVGDRVDPVDPVDQLTETTVIGSDEAELLAVSVHLFNSDESARIVIADKLATLLSFNDPDLGGD